MRIENGVLLELDDEDFENVQENNELLMKLVIPDTVTEILNGIAYRANMSMVDVVEFSDNIEKIPEGFLANWTNVKRVKLPKNLKSILSRAFFFTSSLETITLPEGLVSIGESAFECSSIKKLIIPESVEEISPSAFKCCYDLEKVEFLGNKLNTIENSLFSECWKLEKIDLPESIENIGVYAFRETQTLAQITIPKSVINIYGGAFLNSGLTKVDFLCSSVNVHIDSFNCPKLREIRYFKRSDFEDKAAIKTKSQELDVCERMYSPQKNFFYTGAMFINLKSFGKQMIKLTDLNNYDSDADTTMYGEIIEEMSFEGEGDTGIWLVQVLGEEEKSYCAWSKQYSNNPNKKGIITRHFKTSKEIADFLSI